MKCKDCKYCSGFIPSTGPHTGYYICTAVSEVDYVEQCVGDDENLECDLFVADVDDDN